MSCYDYSDSDVESSSSPQLPANKPGQRNEACKVSLSRQEQSSFLTAQTMSSISSLDRHMSNASITDMSIVSDKGYHPQKLHNVITSPVEIAIWKHRGLEPTSRSAVLNTQSSTNVVQPPPESPVFTFTGPVLRKFVSSKPPPSSPPEYVFEHSLSHPTIPALHHNSVSELIERYRGERADDPAAFDAKTKTIKQGLVAAKIERGGTPLLLLNEYTAELASRLDAEMTEMWLERVEKQYAFSDDEGLEMTYNSGQITYHDQIQQEPEATILSAPIMSKDNDKQATVSQEHASLSPVPAQTKCTDIQSGSICHQSCEYETIDHNGQRTVTRRTFIVISESTDAGPEGDKPVTSANVNSVHNELMQHSFAGGDSVDAMKPGDLIKETLEYLSKLAHEQNFEQHKQVSPDLIKLVRETREKLAQLETEGKVAYSTTEK